MKQYRTILFDADNTLFDFFRSERGALTDALRRLGVVPSEDMIATYSAINDGMWKRLERGEITKSELRVARFYEFCRHFSLSLDAPTLANVYMEQLSAKGYLMDGALEVCTALAKRCRLYIITNGIASIQHGRFDRSPLMPLFQGLFISDELGCDKPSKAYFDAVAAAIPDFDPVTTLVVGDSLTSDIAGGIGAGLDTCWLNANGRTAPAEMPITYTIERLEDVIPLVLGV
ncbi:MAG: YjjG family noncanonical pyrimidine nucleotidase [Clostridia bacterium]|nr:YjjG family noncanonical pyrimidine nucleotidase [Clostridia bacterium]